MPSRQPTRTAAATALAGSGDSHPADAAPEPRRPGRPRSEQADQAILSAALDLFAESGPDALCIEQVAARAGVGKATIYRRWPGKEDMLVDALGRWAQTSRFPRGGLSGPTLSRSWPRSRGRQLTRDERGCSRCSKEKACATPG